MSRKLGPEQMIAVANDMWADGEPDDICKLAVAERLISEKYKPDGMLKPGIKSLSIAEVGMLAKERLGDRWPSSAQRQSLGLPRLVDVLAQDPFIKTSGAAHTLQVSLDLQRFAEITGQAQPKPKPGAPDIDWPAREGVLPCSHYARHGWCALREKCLYHHPEPGTPGGPKLQKLSAKQQAEQKRLHKQAQLQDQTPVPPTKLELKQQAAEERAAQRRASMDAGGSGAGPSSSTAARTSSTGAEGVVANGSGGGAGGASSKGNCPHYMDHGWCKHKATCTFDHPPLSAEERNRKSYTIRSASPDTLAAGSQPVSRRTSDGISRSLSRSHSSGSSAAEEPAAAAAAAASKAAAGPSAAAASAAAAPVSVPVPVTNSVSLPVSPAASAALDLPVPVHVQAAAASATPAAGPAAAGAPAPGPSSSAAGTSSASSSGQAGPSSELPSAAYSLKSLLGGKPYASYKPKVRQPSRDDLVGLVVDGLYPPMQSKEAYLKGALVKYLVSGANKDTKVLKVNGRVVYQLLSAKAGAWLKGHWRTEQRLYDFEQKPYNSLNELVQEEDGSWIEAVTGAKNASCVQVDFAQLLTQGARAGAARFAAIAEVAWPATSTSKDQWLCAALAKHIAQARMTGETIEELMAVAQGSPTAFRIHSSAAGTVLRRLWTAGGHPFDPTAPPYDTLNQLFKGEPYLHVETAPDNPATPHITLDVAKLITIYPTLLKRARAATAAAAAAASPSAPSGAGSRSQRPMSRAGSSSQLSEQGQQQPQQQQQLHEFGSAALPDGDDDDDDDGKWQQVGASGTRAAAARAAGVAGVTGLPPVERWWVSSEPSRPDWVWAEACARLVHPEDGLEVAEMCQHLEGCQILGLACANYQKIPHMLQIFAPHVSMMGMELPATAYVLDLINQRAVMEVMAMIKPVLESRHVIKVCHGSKLWAGLLRRYFAIELRTHYDTQAGHAAVCQMRQECGRLSLKLAADVSFASLLGHYNFHHPVRHEAGGQKNSDKNRLLWQVRPLSDDLFVCAAADVALLIPALETQLPQVQAAAAELRRFYAGPGRTMRPHPDSAMDMALLERLSQGTGGSFQKLAEWASQKVFHQEPMPGYS